MTQSLYFIHAYENHACPQTHKGPSRVCRVVIVLLNGRKLEAMVDPSLTGQQLYEAVVTEIDLPEFYFFGLTYINGNTGIRCEKSYQKRVSYSLSYYINLKQKS